MRNERNPKPDELEQNNYTENHRVATEIHREIKELNENSVFLLFSPRISV